MGECSSFRDGLLFFLSWWGGGEGGLGNNLRKKCWTAKTAEESHAQKAMEKKIK